MSVALPASVAHHSTQAALLSSELDHKLMLAKQTTSCQSVAISLAVPRREVTHIARSMPRDHRLLWRGKDGFSVAAYGIAAQALGQPGASRFSDVITNSARTLAEVEQSGLEAPALCWFGGFSFASTVRESRWQAFGVARFILPRWRYTSNPSSAHLTLVCNPRQPGEFARARREFDELWHSLHRPLSTAPPAMLGAAVEQNPHHWAALVHSILDEIRHRRVDKIALARRSEVALADHADPFAVATRLATNYPNCQIFAFENRDQCFVGATPERLIRKQGLYIDSQALAGSIASSQEDAANQLLVSAKNRIEQHVVVKAIAEQLMPYCTRLRFGKQPSIHELRNVLHLRTDICGQLKKDLHIVELCRHLHPTPAVGGYPRAQALAWLAAKEPMERGWYTAPVGWFDGHGNGEFAVAIRCALCEPGRAYTYAGAGIVADSNPLSEYDETGLKQRTVLGAL